MARKRDFRKEYQRRIARGKARGMSVAQSRGHPRKGEPPLSSPAALPKSDAGIEAAIGLMRDGASMTQAAGRARVSSKRLSQFIKAHRIAKYKGRNWVWIDGRVRQMPFLIGDRQQMIKLRGFEAASQVGKYYAAVRRFLNSNDPSHLDPFVGQTVKDVRGQVLTFETDPNNIYRFADRDEPAFHEIYQAVAA